MKLVSKVCEFQKIQNTLIIPELRLPKMVFHSEITCFLYLTFDDLFLDGFFYKLKNLSRSFQDEIFYVSSISPDPETYYFHHFRNYGTIIFNGEDEESEYLSALHDVPEKDSPDAIAAIGDVIVISSFSDSWALYACRDSNLLVCGFSHQSQKEEANKIFNEDLIGDLQEASSFAFSESSDYETMIKNYGV